MRVTTCCLNWLSHPADLGKLSKPRLSAETQFETHDPGVEVEKGDETGSGCGKKAARYPNGLWPSGTHLRRSNLNAHKTSDAGVWSILAVEDNGQAQIKILRERKSTVFRPPKRPELSILNRGPFTVRFARVFRSPIL
jgi:hypothetical protein